MQIAVLRGLEKLSARNLPLYLPENTGESWSRELSPGRNKAGSPAVWLDSDGWAGWKRSLQGSQPGQRAGCSHQGCWGRCQARAGGFLGSFFGEAAFLHCPAVATGFVGMSLCPWNSARTQSQMGMDCSSSTKAFRFVLRGVQICPALHQRCSGSPPSPLEAGTPVTGSLFSEQLWWILLKQHFPCSKLPPLPFLVWLLCACGLLLKESLPTWLFFYFYFYFLVDPDYKHYFRMMWFSSINSWSSLSRSRQAHV